jgi:hypothetical protein
MLDEFEYPSRDLRLAAQVFNCKREIADVIEWLRAEVEKEISIEAMFDDSND